MSNNPYKQYKEQAIITMTPGELIVELYDGCIKKLNASIIYIDEKIYDKANTELQGAQKIINYLNACLNNKYDISNELSALYHFYAKQIVQANIRKDTAIIKELIPMITDLRNAFRDAEKQIHKK